MLKTSWFAIKRWILSFIFILGIASLGRTFPATIPPGQLDFASQDFTTHFLVALKAPLTFFSPSNQPNLSQVFQHIPTSIFLVTYAFIASYILGVLKGLADIFWARNPLFKAFQGVAWLLDAIPMFGIIILLEVGSLYAAMYIKGDPIRMIPDYSFFLGDFLRANVLMWAPMMYVSRMMAMALKEEGSAQYVITARGKGISEQRVLFRHVFLNIVPKLINESFNVFNIILSGLLALEYLSLQTHGAMFNLLSGMGHGILGQPSLYVDQSPFHIHLVVDYLLLLSLFMTAFQLFGTWLQKRWEVVHHA